MRKNKLKEIGKKVIDLEINALRKLKLSLNKSFDEAVMAIINCKGKIVVCGVGKSYLIGQKISSTLSSVGCPSFSINANECSHGDLGSISRRDTLILLSNSGSTEELKPVIQYANRNKIVLIGITSKRNSILTKASDIKILIPEVKEAALNLVPTSSSTEILALGDSLAVAALNIKKFNKKKFKILHPGGNISNQLKTVEDLMISNKGIPFIKENSTMKNALNLIRRSNQKKGNVSNLKVKDIMTKNPITVEKDTLAAKGLSIMSEKKITSLCVHKKKKIKKKL